MGLFSRFKTIARVSTVDGSLIPERMAQGRGGSVAVTHASALRHSAVWAALRVRADLISTMPVDVYRMVDGVQVEVSKPPVLISPGGERMPVHEWLYSTQIDLDRAGNAFGLITARDGLGYPARIELVDVGSVSVVIRHGQLDHYRINGSEYSSSDVWHEKQYTLAGLHIGLSPVAYAAWSISQQLSAQQFALDWFSGNAIPAASLKNTAQTINKDQASEIKATYKAVVSAGDVFVHGKDWELTPLQATTSDANFLAAQNASAADIARFFGVPGDIIDVPAANGGSVTYASISQRNLQLLIMNIGPAVTRREKALSELLPRPRFVKLNRSALLAMDPETRARVLGQQVRDRLIAPSEARALENLRPFTSDQLSEFDRLFGAPRTEPAPTFPGVS